VLIQAEDEAQVVEIRRQCGIGEQGFCCSKKYSGPGLSDPRELQQLREDNAKLKPQSPICCCTGSGSGISSEKSSSRVDRKSVV
jgi:hypothetical protein